MQLYLYVWKTYGMEWNMGDDMYRNGTGNNPDYRKWKTI